LIVKESNGNLLEVKTKNNVKPNDLTIWRTIPEVILDSLVLIAKGNISGEEEIPEQNSVITTQIAWDSLINAMNLVNNVSNSFTEINIDFSKYQIIAVFDKIRPNIGWTVDITDVTEYADSIVIMYTNLGIGDSICLMIQPYYIVKIPLSEKPIVFHDETVPTNYPITIPFAEYSLDSVSCQWTNFASDTVIIINSNNELENYITCTGGNYSAVDFNQYSLLLLYGNINKYLFSTTVTSLTHLCPNNYLLDVEMSLNDTAVITQEWHIAIMVPKLATNANITLNKNYQNGDGFVPYINCISTYIFDTIPLMGTGYLFIDSLPGNIQYSTNVMYIVYYKEQDSAIFYAPDMLVYKYPPSHSPIPWFTGFSGIVCNLPDYAKEWNIPVNGKQIYYDGVFYETDPNDFQYNPYHGQGYLILTTLK
jgi:hypothetical protein